MTKDTKFDAVGGNWAYREYSAERGNITLYFDWDDKEGLDGDYDEDDPNDVPLLRMSVYMDNGKYVERSSYCTMLDARMDTAILFGVMGRMMDMLHRAVDDEKRVDDIPWICQRFSWLRNTADGADTNVENICRAIEDFWSRRKIVDSITS